MSVGGVHPATSGEVPFPDQDALNVVLHGTVKYLPYGYNFQDLWYTRDYQWIRLHASKFKEVERWKEHPVVVHFAGGGQTVEKGLQSSFHGILFGVFG